MSYSVAMVIKPLFFVRSLKKPTPYFICINVSLYNCIKSLSFRLRTHVIAWFTYNSPRLIHGVWSNLHLSETQRIMEASKRFPFNTEILWIARTVQAVQVGIVTVVEPPASLVKPCTVLNWNVVVLVASAELGWHMISKWITCKQYQHHVARYSVISYALANAPLVCTTTKILML